MRILRLVCKSCGASFESGVPLCPELVTGVRLRALEICPDCGAPGDYDARDYREPEDGEAHAAGADESTRTGRSGRSDEA